MVPAELLGLLVCPRCGAPLRVDGGDSEAWIECIRGHRHPFAEGYLDLSEQSVADRTTARTFESFGYEWNTFDDEREEDAQFAEVYFRDLDLNSMSGKTGLDAGCGKGRYTRFLAPRLSALVALDGSSAVRAAARNLRDFPNVLVLRADLRSPPLARERFDLVVCLGVLHHLEHPREGFDSLVKLLAPGGTMLVYVYSRPLHLGIRRFALACARFLRKLTVRIPHALLKQLSAPIAALLYVFVVQPGAAGDRLGLGVLARLPMAGYRGKPFRSLVLDTFDRLSAPVEHRYIWAELAGWFDEAGLVVDSARDEGGWFVTSHRPTRTPVA